MNPWTEVDFPSTSLCINNISIPSQVAFVDVEKRCQALCCVCECIALCASYISFWLALGLTRRSFQGSFSSLLSSVLPMTVTWPLATNWQLRPIQCMLPK
jgi:hypothetical protein